MWLHSIELGDGIVTPGGKDTGYLARELESLCLPDLHGKDVLDIGAADGFLFLPSRARRCRPGCGIAQSLHALK
jgi:hypothetical protein